MIVGPSFSKIFNAKIGSLTKFKHVIEPRITYTYFGAYDNTAVILTSDHGDMCGSHGLRSKGPFVYEEIMRVPLYVRAPGITTPGTTTDALSTHIDLARTVASLAGADDPSLVGQDLLPVLRDPSTPPFIRHERFRVVRRNIGRGAAHVGFF